MPKRRLILGILALGFLAALIFVFTRPREPSYQGRSLSQWMDIYHQESEPTDFTAEEARTAMRHIGTNGIPLLVAWMQYEPGHLTRAADHFASQRLGLSLLPYKRYRRASAAVNTIAELARDYDLERLPAIQGLADDPTAGPLTQGRLQLLKEILSRMQPRPGLYYLLAKEPLPPAAITNAPPE